ncbi:MAG TPA: dipeptide ABC transporter ATP-binding protein [Phycicoccus sp.]|nr:dipeptide ABC transporter ATP-binding protein [Phycicoccus sp.]
MTTPLLSLSHVTKTFPVRGSGLFRRTVDVVHAVDDVTLDVRPGETLGLVGETGCGKSTLARCISRLYDVDSGTVTFAGEDITRLTRTRMRGVRRDVQMVFQDPYGSLNPRRRVGSIIGDPFVIHDVGTPAERKRRVQELMERVGLNPEHYNRFPAEFSGGQRQRIGVARALALRPRLIICDEPVSALDVSIQAQVVNLLLDLQEEFGLTYVFISHDLSVVRHVSDRIAVMYLGKVVEVAPSAELFAQPRHPYTRALLSALPVADPDVSDSRRRIVLAGDLPTPTNPPSGCRFHTRCPKAREDCAATVPPLERVDDDRPDHVAACLYPLRRGEDLAAARPHVADSEITEAAATGALLEHALPAGGPAGDEEGGPR